MSATLVRVAMRAHADQPAEPQRTATAVARAVAVPPPVGTLAARIGNRAMGQLLARRRTLARAPATSPSATERPDEAAVEEGHELTTPDEAGGAGAEREPGAPPATWAVAVQDPDSLTIKDSGAIEGSYGIGDYWPVTKYWGDDKALGKFDEASTGGWRMIGHKFQVVGAFTTGTTSKPGGGGNVKFLQEARITNTKGGTAGPWFDDMDYTDAGGGKHHWDPNAEAGTTDRTGYPGVRRTIDPKKYAYTDPPAVGYKPGHTNTYRKLEFKIHLKPPPGSSGSEIVKTATQEIEVVRGVPNVLQWP
jgi:hypothetical protein